MSDTNIEKTARFDTRLPVEQKKLFERAVKLGGFRSLTEFILAAAKEKAKEIIEESEMILASRRDEELFFSAVMNPESPNAALKEAAKLHNELLSQ